MMAKKVSQMFSKRVKFTALFVSAAILLAGFYGGYKYYYRLNIFDTNAPLLASDAVDGRINLIDGALDVDDLPAGWVHRIFYTANQTEYKLIDFDGRQALHCATDNSGSILGRDVSLKLSEFPLLKWQWKIEKPLESDVDEETSEGDDHPARFFVVFEGDTGVRKATEIIWSNKRFKAGDYKILGNFYHLVANGLNENIGIWHDETVNLLDLYKVIGGKSADPSLQLLGFFCDSDNTGGKTSAYFSDVHFEAKAAIN
ncbi:MAG: DUF3047 domain-containing protein [Hyphomicrobiales bacterium]